MPPFGSQERTLVDQLMAINCDPQTQYNEFGSLFSGNSVTAMRLVRFPDLVK